MAKKKLMDQETIFLIHSYIDNLKYYGFDDPRRAETKKIIIDLVKKA